MSRDWEDRPGYVNVNNKRLLEGKRGTNKEVVKKEYIVNKSLYPFHFWSERDTDRGLENIGNIIFRLSSGYIDIYFIILYTLCR